MNKNVYLPAGVVDDVAARAHLTKKAARAAIRALLLAVQLRVVQGETVQFKGFGTFYQAHRKARRYRRFAGDVYDSVPAKDVTAFRDTSK